MFQLGSNNLTGNSDMTECSKIPYCMGNVTLCYRKWINAFEDYFKTLLELMLKIKLYIFTSLRCSLFTTFISIKYMV